ncbi:MAG TPA: SpoIIE family protein phosphatase, partial [Candidatus Wallbacteria bacterium]|nr:SpoIIE family protein phosphatase [Candidatus Wallbacteria bacterium]
GGDILLLYTDGLVEAKNPEGESFGRARLCEIIKSSSRAGAEEIKEAIINRLTGHLAGGALADDAAFIAVKVG